MEEWMTNIQLIQKYNKNLQREMEARCRESKDLGRQKRERSKTKVIRE